MVKNKLFKRGFLNQKKKSSKKKQKNIPPQVSIVMGSQTDAQMMEDAASLLKNWNIPFEFQVVSAHRTPKKMQSFALKAHQRGIKIIIAGAGGAAHLPGMIASLTPLPVIGVPVTVGSLQGLDALLSIVQMPKGVPVATMAVDNSYNAGLLAIRILALHNRLLLKKLNNHKIEQEKKVQLMNKNIRKKNQK